MVEGRRCRVTYFPPLANEKQRVDGERVVIAKHILEHDPHEVFGKVLGADGRHGVKSRGK
jgi:hypothetical protein